MTQATSAEVIRPRSFGVLLYKSLTYEANQIVKSVGEITNSKAKIFANLLIVSLPCSRESISREVTLRCLFI